MKNAILIVDDSRLNRETLAAILKDKYNIIEAEDGRSGLEVLEKRKDDIVLVILDIVMPGMDGFAFMEEARTRESIRNIPIVVATTENDYQTEKRCLELGVWDFIPKVFQPEIIRFRVLNTIKRSMAHSLEHVIVDFRGFKWLIQTTDHSPVGARIGIKIDPDGIHIMKKSPYSGMFGDYSSFSEEYEEMSDANWEADEEESEDEK